MLGLGRRCLLSWQYKYLLGRNVEAQLLMQVSGKIRLKK